MAPKQAVDAPTLTLSVFSIHAAAILPPAPEPRIHTHPMPFPKIRQTLCPSRTMQTILPARCAASACNVNAVIDRHHSPARMASASAAAARHSALSGLYAPSQA